MVKCVVVVMAENGEIAAAYNEDGFTSVECLSPNLKGVIASVNDDGGYGEIFHRNDRYRGMGIVNYLLWDPVFGIGWAIHISDNCHQNDNSKSILGGGSFVYRACQ